MRQIVRLLLPMLLTSALPALANETIAADFRAYYVQQVVSANYLGPLDFLRDAAAAHIDTGNLLQANASRKVIVDPGNGYLRIDDSSTTDQALTLAEYRRADGSLLLVAGSSNCADGCTFSVEFFVASNDRLQLVPAASVLPTIAAAQFIAPGHSMPEALATITPSIDYQPARVGTTLMLRPWYGYEAEEQMSSDTRAAIRTVVLDWDAMHGRFVLTPRRPGPAAAAVPPRPASPRKYP